MPSALDPDNIWIDFQLVDKAAIRSTSTGLGKVKLELDHGGFAEGIAPENYTPADTKTESHLAAIDAELGNVVNTSDLPYFLATDYGIKFDGFEAGFSSDLTSDSPIITRAGGSYDWSSADVGKVIWFVLNDGSRWKSSILSAQSASQVTLVDNAPVTQTGRPTRFGTDNTTALNSLCTMIRDLGLHFGTILLPRGMGVITGRILTGHGVMLKGAGGIFATQIWAAPGTYTDDCMIRLDDPDNSGQFQHQQIVEGLRLQADGNVDKCIYTNNLNENGGLFDLELHGYNLKGFHCTGTSLNFSIHRVSCGLSFGGADAVGMHITGSDRISIAEGTINGGGDNLGVGILVDGGTANVTITSTHHEAAEYGIRVDSGSVSCIGIHGHGSVSYLVYGNGGQVVAMNLFPYWGGQKAFKDFNEEYTNNAFYASRFGGFHVSCAYEFQFERQAEFRMGNWQSVPSLDIIATSNTPGPFIKLQKHSVGELVIDQDFSISGLMSPWANATGDQSSAPSGQSRKLTGNVTNVPVTSGWWAKYYAVGADRVVTPVSVGSPPSGSCILPDGTTQATVTIAEGTRAVVHGDGTSLIVDGASVT